MTRVLTEIQIRGASAGIPKVSTLCLFKKILMDNGFWSFRFRFCTLRFSKLPGNSSALSTVKVHTPVPFGHEGIYN